MIKKKKKFKPLVTRIKLNPEQAVLACSCYVSGNVYGTRDDLNGGVTTCNYGLKTIASYNMTNVGSSGIGS